jgi:hypothetical protein
MALTSRLPCGGCGRFAPGKPLDRKAGECKWCWFYHHDPAYRARIDGGEVPPVQPQPPVDPQTIPSRLWKWAGQAWSYMEAKARWKLAGSPVTPPAVLAIREATCRGCGQHDAARDGCRVCGCGIDGGSLAEKRSMATEECPADPPRWLALPLAKS